MSEATNLRQATAKAEVEGILSEKKLEETVINNKNVIRGNVTIQTSDINFVDFQVYVSELKNDGNPNPAYKGIQTVMDQYKSIAEFGKDNATIVRVTNGQVRPNTYFGQDGMKHENLRYNASFFSRVSPEDHFDPKAAFSVEIFISSITPEVYKTGENQGEETGRVIVKGWLPMYNSGIEPIVLIAPKEDGIADAIAGGYEAGQTVMFYGNIVNSKVVKTKVVPVKIGKPKVETTTEYHNELLIDGASEAYEEDSNPASFDKDAVKKAIAEHEHELEEKAEKAKTHTQSHTSTSKTTNTSGRPFPTF